VGRNLTAESYDLWRKSMRQQFSRGAIIVLLVLLAVLVGRPYLDTLLFAATSPRPIAARNDLAEAERATIGLFERVSP
jgi:2-alkenal reductase